jgi:KR domain
VNLKLRSTFQTPFRWSSSSSELHQGTRGMQQGAMIHLIRCDLSSRCEMANLCHGERTFIRGFVHLGGALQDNALVHQTLAHIR